jgi:Uma2 family endonuclease
MGVQQAIIEEREPVRHLLTVDEFLILDEAGAFEELGRVELIDGEIFVLSPLFRPHARAQIEIMTAFANALRAGDFPAEALAPVSAKLDKHNLPEADLLVVSGGDSPLVQREEVMIAVEVSASSLRHDLGRKASLYARMGVPEYWVLDVKGQVVIRLVEPVDGAYMQRDEFPFGATVPSATIPGLVVDTTYLA